MMKCDDCGKTYVRGDLFICPKCGHQWCLPCSFKGETRTNLANMMTCPKCGYIIKEDDKISEEKRKELRKE